MSGPIRDEGANRTKEMQDEWLSDDGYTDYNNSANYDFDNSAVGNQANAGNTHPTSPYGVQGAGNPYAPGSAQSKALSTGGNFPEPPQSSQANDYIQQLAQQGLSNVQIKQQVQAMYGFMPTDAQIQYAKQGLGGFPNSPPNGYPQYSNTKNFSTMSKAYGTPGFQQWMDQQQQVQDAKDTARNLKKSDQQSKVKIHMIMLQILMGDIAGALRSYAVLMDRDLRTFSRLIVNKLDAVRKARSMVIRNFAHTTPPRAYAGDNPQSAANAQDRSAKYTQFVQMSTQLMNELQNTEKEMVDALQTQFRNSETMWQSVAGFRDEQFRTNDRVMTMR